MSDAGEAIIHGLKDAVKVSEIMAENERLREVVALLDAHWTEDFPNGPDTELREGCSFSDDTLEIWRKARAALSVGETGEKP